MTNKNICENCIEYSVEYECGVQEQCILMELVKENKKLKIAIKSLREQVKNLEAQSVKNSWINNPERMGGGSR